MTTLNSDTEFSSPSLFIMWSWLPSPREYYNLQRWNQENLQSHWVGHTCPAAHMPWMTQMERFIWMNWWLVCKVLLHVVVYWFLVVWRCLGLAKSVVGCRLAVQPMLGGSSLDRLHPCSRQCVHTDSIFKSILSLLDISFRQVYGQYFRILIFRMLPHESKTSMVFLPYMAN